MILLIVLISPNRSITFDAVPAALAVAMAGPLVLAVVGAEAMIDDSKFGHVIVWPPSKWGGKSKGSGDKWTIER